MKRKFHSSLVFAISLILIILSANVFAFANEEKVFMFPADVGDLNGDGKVTVVDARSALRVALKIEPNITDYMRSAADSDDNGKVDVVDARRILRLSLNLERHPYNEAVFEEALNLYVTTMNKAKAEKPGFSMIYYLDAPSDKKDRSIIASEELLEILEGFFDEAFEELEDGSMNITREEALEQKVTVNKNSDMSIFPLLGRDEGAISFNHRLLKDASITDTKEGNKQVRIVLNNEKNPRLLEKDDDIKNASFTSLVFFPMSDDEVSIPDTETSYDHFNCTAIIEYNPSTGQLVSLKHEVNVSLIIKLSFKFIEEGEGVEIGFMQNVYSTYEWFDFEY